MALVKPKHPRARRKRHHPAGLPAIAAAVAAVLARGLIANADISGFSAFSGVNKEGVPTGDTQVGYQSANTVFELTDGMNSEGSSGFDAAAQGIGSFTANFNYQTIPEYPTGGSFGGSAQANGAAMVFQNATTGATNAIGGVGNQLAYNGMPNSATTAALEFNLFDGVTAFHGGTSFQTSGSVIGTTTSTQGNILTPDLSTGDTFAVRLSYNGTTLTQYIVDTNTGSANSFTYTGVNLASTLGSSMAIIGFTGSTGGYNSTQKISNFSFVATPTFSPIAVAGFNQNMVIPAGASQTGATSTITASMDSGTANLANNVWYEKGYNTAAPATGLPASGSTFTSQNDSLHTFKMQSYTGSGDAILLSNSSGDVHTSGTLTLTTPAAYKAISLLESSGNGPNYFNVIINYSDGAPASTIPDVIAPNWFNQTANIACVASGRAVPSSSSTTSFNSVGTMNPVLTQQDLALPDTTDPISSILFTWASGSGNTAIFAVSGAATPTSPILIYTGAQAPGVFNSSSDNFANPNPINFTPGSVVQFDDSATLANNNHNITVSAGISPGGVIFANNTSSYTLGGAGIGGTFGLTLSGTGTVTLNNSNTFTGATLVNAGLLVVAAGGNLASNNITIEPAGTLNVSAGTLSSRTLGLSDSGTVFYGGTALSLAALAGSGSLTFTSSASGTLTLTGSGTFTGSVNQTSPGVVNVVANSANVVGSNPILNGVSNYSGGTYLTAGLLQIGTSGAIGTGPVYFQGGAIGGSSISTSASPVTVNNPFVFNQSTGLKFDATNPAIFTNDGALALGAGVTPIVVTTNDTTSSKLQIAANITDPAVGGSGALNLTGDFALTGTNTYSGGTTVNATTDVATSNPSGFGSGIINFNTGGIGTLASATGLTFANPFQMGSATAGASFDNSNAFTMSGPGFLGYGATVSGGAFTGGNASGGSFTVSAPSVNLSGQLTGGALVLVSGSNLLELAGNNNTFTGPIIVQGTSGSNLGGTLKIDTAGGLGSATSILVGSGGSLEIGTGTSGMGANLTITGTGVVSTYANPIPNGPTGALRGADEATSTWAGNINISGPSYIASGTDGTLILTGAITGTGPVTFTGNSADSNGATIILIPPTGNANAYTGETQLLPDINANVTSGTLLQLGSDNGISQNSGLKIIDSGRAQFVTVDLNGHNQAVKYLSGPAETGYVITNSGGAQSTLTITSGLSGTSPSLLTTPIHGNIAVVMNDPTGLGNQILNGNNSYTAGTTIIRGTLTAASATAFGSNPVSLQGGTLALAAAISAGSPIVTGNNFSSFNLSQGTGAGGASLPSVSGNTLTLTTNGNSNTSNSAFSPNKVAVSDSLGFTAKFTYNVTAGYADGIAFVLQNDPRGPGAVSSSAGSDLGYGGTNKITSSAAVEFEIYPFVSHGTAFGSNGLIPGDAGNPTTQYTGTSPVNIATKPLGTNYVLDEQPVDVTLVYNGPAQTLTETLYGETEHTTFTTTYTGVDYAALAGGTAGGSTTAYLGFTAGTGAGSSTQVISNFSYATNLSTPQSIGNAIIAASGISLIQLGITTGSTATGATVGPVSISSGAIVSVTSTSLSRGVLFTPSLSIAGTAGAFSGKLDLNSNDLVITAQSLAQITAMVAAGCNSGAWNGNGIASSAAASNPLTALGAIVNDNASGSPLYGPAGTIALTFDGSAPSDGNILVKYTYYGDANLDGHVDGSDYSLIDNAFLQDQTYLTQNPNGSSLPLTGWFNGDFNYDGVINGSDYTLIDNAFNTQGADLASSIAGLDATATVQIGGLPASVAVPEPAMLGLLCIGSMALLGRGRRAASHASQRLPVG